MNYFQAHSELMLVSPVDCWDVTYLSAACEHIYIEADMSKHTGIKAL